MGHTVVVDSFWPFRDFFLFQRRVFNSIRAVSLKYHLANLTLSIYTQPLEPHLRLFVSVRVYILIEALPENESLSVCNDPMTSPLTRQSPLPKND